MIKHLWVLTWDTPTISSPESTVSWWQFKSMLILEVFGELPPDRESSITDMAAVEKPFPFVGRPHVMIEVLSCSGDVETVWL